ncbi:MAG: dihydrodipicolinate synthase family protein [Bacteroidales bacterium]|nr:dihydrodipicolinate synthase family protein [Bacteroidales bacterium]
MKKIKKYEGLVAAPFTPMDKNGNLNAGMIPEYYNFLEKNGIIGAFINGTTGEGVSLSQKEKQVVATKWTACLKEGGKVRVINLVGGTSYKECIENAVFSREIGMSAIAVMAPYFFKPVDATQLAEFVARVGEAVPDMPVYFYHIPVLTGVYMPLIGFMKKICEMIPNFAGIKYTNEDFMDFLSCLNYKEGAYDLLWGRDECILSALILGCKGAVGSTYNYAAPLYQTLISSFNKGYFHEAKKLQQRSVDMIELFGKYGGIATGKAFMKYIGLDCGKFRLPVKNMTDKMYEDFVKDVELLNMNKFFSIR